jgi:hypothetical protein
MSPTPTLAPPRAAAVAGVVFAVLMSVSLILVRLAVPAGFRNDPGRWLTDPVRRNAVRLAIQLAPFAGIAFLWFIGVLRNRLGKLEDQFFATVFLGSGLLFVTSLFASIAFSGALIDTVASGNLQIMDTGTYYLARQFIAAFTNVFGIKMAGVFTFSTSMVIFRTGILPRWVAFLGFSCGVVLLLAVTSWPWITLLFPFWILIVSLRILLVEYGKSTGE